MVERIICESGALAIECLRAVQPLQLPVATEVQVDWFSAALSSVLRGATAVVVETPVSLEQLVELAHAARATAHDLLMASLWRGRQADWLRQAGLDLGVTLFGDVEPLLCAIALLHAGARRAWSASTRQLDPADRIRLEPGLDNGPRSGGTFASAEAGFLSFGEDATRPGALVGKARDVALALVALRDTDRQTPQIESSVDVDGRAVLDVLFGPKRALSDPASKAALSPYGIPLPLEELCASASRAAAEASRIGYPVRISLASPDLRVWDHPDLAIDMVDNAAKVRDTFRQLMGLARARLQQTLPQEPAAADRLLGVMVTATSEASALLGVRAWPLPRGRVGMQIGFADPHGMAAHDATLAVLPAPLPTIERVLRRLQGSALLFGGQPGQNKANLESIGDVLLRLSAFTHERREHVEAVELRPLALGLDGSVEVRQACVSVSDAFERSFSVNARAP